MKTNIAYFGYGAMASSGIISAVIGRTPNGIPAELDNYDLIIQTWAQIPEAAKKILSNSWGSDFKSYAIKEGEGTVKGKIWYLTEYERELVKDWELTGLWFKEIKGNAKTKDGTVISIVSEGVDKTQKGSVVNGRKYPLILNNKEATIALATKVRIEFEKRTPRPEREKTRA